MSKLVDAELTSNPSSRVVRAARAAEFHCFEFVADRSIGSILAAKSPRLVRIQTKCKEGSHGRGHIKKAQKALGRVSDTLPVNDTVYALIESITYAKFVSEIGKGMAVVILSENTTRRNGRQSISPKECANTKIHQPTRMLVAVSRNS